MRFQEDTKKHKHHKWTPEEDAALVKILSQTKVYNWDMIAKKMYNRNARQCKERWFYYLSPDVNNGEWTHEEDQLLISKVKEYGTRWQKIAQFFKGRTNTNCKNRWLAMKREESKGVKSPQIDMKIDTLDSPINSDQDSLSGVLGDDFFSQLNISAEQLNWDIFPGLPSVDLF